VSRLCQVQIGVKASTPRSNRAYCYPRRGLRSAGRSLDSQNPEARPVPTAPDFGRVSHPIRGEPAAMPPLPHRPGACKNPRRIGRGLSTVCVDQARRAWLMPLPQGSPLKAGCLRGRFREPPAPQRRAPSQQSQQAQPGPGRCGEGYRLDCCARRLTVVRDFSPPLINRSDSANSLI